METAAEFESLEAAGAAVRAGAVIAYAAEGVMGLGCDPFSDASVQRVISIKGRAAEKGLIVLCATVAHARQLVDGALGDFEKAAEQYWPGPTTLILPAGKLPANVTGGRDSVALRVPSFVPLSALVEACGGFLISTSANFSGEPSPLTARELDPGLLGQVSGIVPGEVQGLGGATSIIDVRSGSVIR